MRVPGRCEQLEQLIFGHGKNLKPRPCALAPSLEPFIPQPIRPPGTVIPLSELPDDHPARIYIRERNFDAQQLTDIFNIGLCINVDEPKYAATRGRLYIPITYRHELVGWQARTINSYSQPKYLNASGMRKSTLLYNYDQAQSQPYVIVVEGVPSVWRLGKAAVALFGKTMSLAQQDLIARTWPNKPVILMLDHDAKDEMARATELLGKKSMQVVPVVLPDSRDPADYSEEDISHLLFEHIGVAPQPTENNNVDVFSE